MAPAFLPPFRPLLLFLPACQCSGRIPPRLLLFKSVFRDAEIVHELVKGGGR